MLFYMVAAVVLLIGIRSSSTEASCTNDFEGGSSSLVGWTKTGDAFNNQPTYGDNPSIRRAGIHVNHHGNYWIGTFENRPNADSRPGMVQSDIPTGTLTSPAFRITGSDINFLIGGGCDQSKLRAELLINGSVADVDTGKCSETMRRVHWSVGHYKGQIAKIRLVDNSSGGWGHLNFDDLKGDIKCKEKKFETIRTFLDRMKAIIRPVKQTSFISDINKLEEKFNNQKNKHLGFKMNKQTDSTSVNTRVIPSSDESPRKSPTRASSRSKMNSKKPSTSPTSMEEGGAKPTSSNRSSKRASSSSKMNSKKPSTSPTSMEEGGATPPSSNDSPTRASSGRKMNSKKPSTSPTSMEEGGATSKPPNGSPIKYSSKMNTKKQSTSPTLLEKGEARSRSSKETSLVASKAFDEVTPSKRMSTAQRNLNIKSLAPNLLYQGATNKQTKEGVTNYPEIMDTVPINSTNNSSESMGDASPRRKLHLFDNLGYRNKSQLKSDQAFTNFKNLNCKDFIMAILLETKWKEDLMDPNTMYYQKTRQGVEVQILNLYGEDEDFRGIQFEKFGRTENKNISKVYVVLKFANADKYLPKLIDVLGTRNVIAAGCYKPPQSCPNYCSSNCSSSCQPSCCTVPTRQPDTHVAAYNNPFPQQNTQEYSNPVYNTPPQQPIVYDPASYGNSHSPLASANNNNLPSSFSPECPVGCQYICSTQCPSNCCRSAIPIIKRILYYKRTL